MNDKQAKQLRKMAKKLTGSRWKEAYKLLKKKVKLKKLETAISQS